MSMTLLVFQPTSDVQTFIDLWSQMYDHQNAYEHNYVNHIKPDKPFTHKDLLELYEWLTGAGLGRIRTAAIKDKIYAHIDYINDMKFENSINIDEFQKKFSSVSAVSRIFLLHLIKPEVYPLYDTNIHIAYNYIHGISNEQQPYPRREEDRMKFYFRKILPFVTSIKGNNSIKKVDEALNSYGQMVRKIVKSTLTF